MISFFSFSLNETGCLYAQSNSLDAIKLAFWFPMIYFAALLAWTLYYRVRGSVPVGSSLMLACTISFYNLLLYTFEALLKLALILWVTKPIPGRGTVLLMYTDVNEEMVSAYSLAMKLYIPFVVVTLTAIRLMLLKYLLCVQSLTESQAALKRDLEKLPFMDPLVSVVLSFFIFYFIFIFGGGGRG